MKSEFEEKLDQMLVEFELVIVGPDLRFPVFAGEYQIDKFKRLKAEFIAKYAPKEVKE